MALFFQWSKQYDKTAILWFECGLQTSFPVPSHIISLSHFWISTIQQRSNKDLLHVHIWLPHCMSAMKVVIWFLKNDVYTQI